MKFSGDSFHARNFLRYKKSAKPLLYRVLIVIEDIDESRVETRLTSSLLLYFEEMV